MIIEYLRKITEIISSIIYIIETQQEEIDKQKKEIECLHKELKALKAHRNIIYTYSPCPYPCSRPLSPRYDKITYGVQNDKKTKSTGTTITATL